jgi:peroxiredoxin
LREQNDEIVGLGSRIVAIGTGNQNYAASFVRDEKIPYLVLVDDDAAAANAASVRTLSWFQLLHPRTWKATRETSKRGYHVRKAGKRVKQVGGTFVIGAAGRVTFEHLDADSTDHADVSAVMDAVRTSGRSAS